MNNKIRVIVTDDSSLMREAIRAILESDPLIEVVGMARDGKDALEKTQILRPDVITMDINMPNMSGLEAIENIMDLHPTSIIVVSSMDVKIIIKSLGLGAMDFVTVNQDIELVGKELIEKVKIASKVKPMHRMIVKPVTGLKVSQKKIGLVNRVVAIGVSTGGPQALQVILSGLPENFSAALVVVQHMTPGFIDGLAEWLKTSSILNVKVAHAGETIQNSTVYLAPDIYNLKINEDFSVGLSESLVKLPNVPSIDIMMQSVALVYGTNAIGVILTGMSRDGVEGIKAIKDYGGVTIAQDEKSSVIFGMNKIAIDLGYVDKVIPLDKIAQELVNLVK